MEKHLTIKTLLVSLFIGLAFGCYFYFTYDHRLARVLISVLSTVSIGVLMMTALRFRFYFMSFTNKQPARIIIMTILLIVAALLGSELAILLQALFNLSGAYRPASGGSIYVLNILIVLVVGIPIYVSEEDKSQLHLRIIEQDYRMLQLQQNQTLSALELLRAKINPHFLYNMHNTIAGLISKDPATAEQLVLLLSRFFRLTLNKDSATVHPMKEELEIVSTYLEMQQIRFGNRLHYTVDVPEELASLPVPSFVIQPLAENAIRHGIETSRDEGYINIAITRLEDNFVLTVADSGPPFPDSPGTGMGLQLVMNKLKLLYEGNHKIELNNHPQKYVRLIFPVTHPNAARR